MDRKILVVDDDPRLGRMTAKVLCRMFTGTCVFLSPSGPAGLAVADRERPHVIVLDHVMPAMDGKEFLASLRQNDWGQNIPVLVMSGYDLEAVYRDEENVEFLRKPPLRTTMEDALVRLLLKGMGAAPLSECRQEFADLRATLNEKIFTLREKTKQAEPLGSRLFRWFRK